MQKHYLVNFDTHMKCIGLGLIFSLCLIVVQAQTTADSLQKDVKADPRLKTAVAKHTEINGRSRTKGYRVQIYFGVDNEKAKSIKSKFLTDHANDAHAYIVYEAPNFKVRIGDFRSRLEAYRFLRKIKAEFPTAFIVETDIE
jgi:hypothetical protein